MARPSKFEQRRRMVRFAELCAEDDSRLEQHVRTVGMSPWRALRLLSDPAFVALVESFEKRSAA